MTTPTEQNILKGCGTSDSVEYEEDYTFCGDEDNKRRLCPFCSGKLEGYQLAQKENKILIDKYLDIDIKTSYDLFKLFSDLTGFDIDKFNNRLKENIK